MQLQTPTATVSLFNFAPK